MSSVIRQETAVFFIFIFHGALLTLLYDVLRALRRSFRHHLLVLSAEDFLYWLLAGFLTFWLSFRETSGALRGYAAVGIFLGFLLYHLTVSRLVVGLLSAVFRLPVTAAAFLRRILSIPVKKICKNCKKRIEFTQKRGYNKRYTCANAEKRNSGRNSCSRRGQAASSEEERSILDGRAASSGKERSILDGRRWKAKMQGETRKRTNGSKKTGK
ncbi:MAG: spore cortex biosynthesis protein YabQ [Lachnospiraceae bacterium]|nr:spore cortex biosynthesis protein YabQ [Lachnospiraceae bacterium]